MQAFSFAWLELGMFKLSKADIMKKALELDVDLHSLTVVTIRLRKAWPAGNAMRVCRDRKAFAKPAYPIRFNT